MAWCAVDDTARISVSQFICSGPHMDCGAYRDVSIAYVCIYFHGHVWCVTYISASAVALKASKQMVCKFLSIF